jgi:hypothetical protein
MDRDIFISLSALAIDFAVCLFFGGHLFLKNEKSRLQKLFVYFFFLFSLFILLTPFYLPGIITKDPILLKAAFLTDFAVLFTISILILSIIFYQEKMKYEDSVIPVWSMASVLSWTFLAFTIDPAKNTPEKWAFWGFTPFSMAIAGLLIGLPFIFASVTFITKGIKEKSVRAKFVLLGVGFLLIIFGGPLHQFGRLGNLFLLADFVTTAGFIALFISLMQKEKAAVAA